MDGRDTPIHAVLTHVAQLVDTETAKVIDFIYTENCVWRECMAIRTYDLPKG